MEEIEFILTPVRNLQSPPQLQQGLEGTVWYRGGGINFFWKNYRRELKFCTQAQNSLLIKVHMRSHHQTPIRNLQSPPNLQSLENDDVYKDWWTLHLYFQPIMLKFGTHIQNSLLFKVHMGSSHQTPIRNPQSPANLQNLENDDVYKDWCSLQLYFQGIMLKFGTHIQNSLLIKFHMGSGHQTPIRKLQSHPNFQNLENDDVYKDWCSLYLYFQPIMRNLAHRL